MKALISLALLIGGVYLVVSSALGVLTSTSQDDTWWYIAWFAGGALCCFLAIPAGLAAGATSNKYQVQAPQERPHGSAEYNDIESTNVTYSSGARPVQSYEERRDDSFERLNIPNQPRREPVPGYVVYGGTRPGERPPPIIEVQPAPARKEAPAPRPYYGKRVGDYGAFLDLPNRED